MIFRAAPSLDLFPTVEDAFDRRYRRVNRRAFENQEETIGAPRNLRRVTAGVRWLIVAGLWLAGAGASPAWLGAQTASVTELKAAFVYNFLRFAEWPPDALGPGVTVVACVAGDERLADALGAIVRSRSADAGPMTVRRLNLDSQFEGCHLLYLGNLDIKQAASVVDTLSGLPVLTVSDLHGFATTAGGVIELLQENDKMRFVINTRTADRLRVGLSSRLLSLATIVKEEPGATQP